MLNERTKFFHNFSYFFSRKDLFFLSSIMGYYYLSSTPFFQRGEVGEESCI